MSTRAALFNALKADTTLTGMLANGANSVINESDDIVNTLKPHVVIHFIGTHIGQGVPELDMELWEIRCFDRGNAYYNIERILERARAVLHRKILDSGTDIPTYSLLECMYDHKERAYFDPVFRAESGSIVFRVAVLHLS